MRVAISYFVRLDNYLSKNSPSFNKNLLPEKIEENKTALRELDDKKIR